MTVQELKQSDSVAIRPGSGKSPQSLRFERNILETAAPGNRPSPISFTASLHVISKDPNVERLEQITAQEELNKRFRSNITLHLLYWASQGYPANGISGRIHDEIGWFLEQEPNAIRLDPKCTLTEAESIRSRLLQKLAIVQVQIDEAMKVVQQKRPLSFPPQLTNELAGLKIAAAQTEAGRELTSKELQDCIGGIFALQNAFTENLQNKPLEEQIRSMRELVHQELAKYDDVLPKDQMDKAREKIDRSIDELPTVEQLEERRNQGVEVFQRMVMEQRHILDEKLKSALFNKMNHFYLNMLNAYPKLHPHFSGYATEEQAAHLCKNILGFCNLEKLDEREREVLESCAEKLQDARGIWHLGRTAGVNDESLVAQMQSRIQNLNIGESCIFIGQGKKHAILYEVVKNSESSCSFTIINTGDDEAGHHQRRPGLLSRWINGTDPREYEHKSYRVPLSGFTTGFLKNLIPSNTVAIPTPQLVAGLDRTLLSQEGVSRQPGRLHQPQSRGNCSIKCIMSWMKGELIREFGEERGRALFARFKHFKAEREYDELQTTIARAPKEQLQEIYSKRTYAPAKDHYDDPAVLLTIPASGEELEQELKLLDQAAIETIDKWKQKTPSPRPPPQSIFAKVGSFLATLDA